MPIREKIERTRVGLLGLGETVTLGGELWQLYPLTIAEEHELDVWSFENRATNTDAAWCQFVIWLSLRKNGEGGKLAEGPWDMSLVDVGEIIPAGRGEELAMRVLEISGLEKKIQRIRAFQEKVQGLLGANSLPPGSQTAPGPGENPSPDPPPAPGPAGGVE